MDAVSGGASAGGWRGTLVGGWGGVALTAGTGVGGDATAGKEAVTPGSNEAMDGAVSATVFDPESGAGALVDGVASSDEGGDELMASSADGGGGRSTDGVGFSGRVGGAGGAGAAGPKTSLISGTSGALVFNWTVCGDFDGVSGAPASCTTPSVGSSGIVEVDSGSWVRLESSATVAADSSSACDSVTSPQSAMREAAGPRMVLVFDHSCDMIETRKRR